MRWYPEFPYSDWEVALRKIRRQSRKDFEKWNDQLLAENVEPNIIHRLYNYIEETVEILENQNGEIQ